MSEPSMAKTIGGVSIGVIVAVLILVFMLCACCGSVTFFAALSRPYTY